MAWLKTSSRRCRAAIGYSSSPGILRSPTRRKRLMSARSAASLACATYLKGSVRRGGNRLRFTGQLVDATSGVHIWADHFDGEPTDVFALQDRFTESIVATIEPKIQLAEIERLKHKPAANLDAYDLVLRAQQFEHEFTAKGLAAAIRCTEEALAIDPNYARAMALAAYCYGERFIRDGPLTSHRTWLQAES